MKPAYRDDIDGLRAIAVLGVLAFHAGLQFAGGGFVGVDVFFVISGFLITQQLLRDVQDGTFTLARFYVRRVRRILPALIVVMLFTTIVAAGLLPPSEFIAYGKSMIAASFGFSNMWFWAHSDYFDPGASGYPLLHTWSLGVEEQFYMVFPLALALLSEINRRRVGVRLPSRKIILWVFAIAVLLSFVGSVIEMHRSPKTAFYWLAPRAWELGIGALLAALALDPLPRVLQHSRVRAAASWIGLSLIVATMALLTEKQPFPGYNAFWPTLGSALLIFAGFKPDANSTARQSIPTRLLSTPAMVGVGLISFSLYLWHWPALLFAKYVHPGPLAGWQLALLVLGMGYVSYLSWRYVERPFRKPALGTQRQILTGGLTAMVLTASLGLLIAVADGLPSRMPQSALLLADGVNDYNPQRHDCHSGAGHTIPWEKLCKYGAPDVSPKLLVWGDSHAVEIAAALGEIAARNGTSVVQASGSQCPAALNFAIDNNKDCREFNKLVLAGVIKSEISDVLLVTSSFGNPYVDRPQSSVFELGLIATVQALQSAGKHVHLLAPVPYVLWPVPRQLSIRKWWNVAPPSGPTLSQYMLATAPTQTVERFVARGTGVPLIETTDAMCPNGQCIVELDGRSLYYDEHHLGMHGARLLIMRTPALLQLVASTRAP